MERDLVLGSICSAGSTKLIELTELAAISVLLLVAEDEVDSSIV